MDNKELPGFIADWLKVTERQVRQAGQTNSAYLYCHINAPIDKVWSAWTESKQLSQWFAKVSGEIKVGLERSFDVGAPFQIASETLKIEPLKIFRFTWSYPGREVDEVEIRLKADDNMTLLELEQYSNDRSDWWFGAGAGWESALIRLDLFLLGNNPKMIPDDKFDELLGPLWITAGQSK
ncbi:MAG TPA: SRPBCC domain-containing protein [Saprospiraceae bacterium]|nr:SRPBCC domain-containing protein [Saprospiraceae bacterium]